MKNPNLVLASIRSVRNLIDEEISTCFPARRGYTFSKLSNIDKKKHTKDFLMVFPWSRRPYGRPHPLHLLSSSAVYIRQEICVTTIARHTRLYAVAFVSAHVCISTEEWNGHDEK